MKSNSLYITTVKYTYTSQKATNRQSCPCSELAKLQNVALNFYKVMTRLSPYMKLYCPDTDILASNTLRLFIIMSKEPLILIHIKIWHFQAPTDPSQLSWLFKVLFAPAAITISYMCLPIRKGQKARKGENVLQWTSKQKLTLSTTFSKDIQNLFLGSNSIKTIPLHNLGNHKSVAKNV